MTVTVIVIGIVIVIVIVNNMIVTSSLTGPGDDGGQEPPQIVRDVPHAPVSAPFFGCEPIGQDAGAGGAARALKHAVQGPPEAASGWVGGDESVGMNRWRVA